MTLCRPPGNIDNSPRIKRWGEQLEKHRAFLSVKSLLFTTLLFVLSGYALISWLLEQGGQRGIRAVPIIQMGNICLIFMTVYFLVVEYLFRNRPQEIRLIQRFVWYLALLFIVSITGLGAALVA